MNARIEYDRDADALTISVRDGKVARTLDAGKGRLLDFDADGQLLAIEALGARAGFILTTLLTKTMSRTISEATNRQLTTHAG